MRLAVLASAAVTVSLSFAPISQTLGAQAAPACDLSSSINKDLAKPWFDVTRAQTAPTPDAKRPILSGVTKELGDKADKYGKNAVGYNYVMSQVLSMWLTDPTIAPVTTRGKLGMSTAADQPYDIVDHMDSAYKAIVAASPNCAASVEGIRESEGWLALVRKSLDASNNSQMDTAVYYANLSMRLVKDSPYPYYVLAAADNANKDYKGAVDNWKKLLVAAGTDTTYQEMRASTRYYLGMRLLDLAADETGNAQKATAADAAENLSLYLADMQPSNPDIPNVMQSLADAYELSGKGDDAMRAMYKPVLANPSAYDDLALIMAGVVASRAKDNDGSLQLFLAAVAKNAWSRDALRNLTATYYAREEFNKMWMPLKALVAIDPNNSDAWLMHAYAAQGLAKDNKDAVAKKAWTDTLIKYSTIADSLPAKIDVNSFQRGKDGSTVTLTVEQAAPTAGNYTVTVEFLDATGAVVGTDEKKVGPLEKGAKKRETFKTTNGTAMAFRYKPLA